MEYKTGDIVTIRRDLKAHTTYGYYAVVEDMAKHAGKRAKVIYFNPYQGYYRLCVDRQMWKWEQEMFEGGGLGGP